MLSVVISARYKDFKAERNVNFSAAQAQTNAGSSANQQADKSISLVIYDLYIVCALVRRREF